MGLAQLLGERVGINILNELYPRQQKHSSVPTLSLEELEQRLQRKINNTTLHLLIDNGLVDVVGNEPKNSHLRITTKGQSFINAFDTLRSAFYREETDDSHKQRTSFLDQAETIEQDNGNTIDIEYVLTDLEEKVLAAIYTISNNTQESVSPQEIIQRIYPHDPYQKKISIISHYTKKLEELNLIRKEKQDRHTLLYITPTGKRTVEKQVLTYSTR